MTIEGLRHVPIELIDTDSIAEDPQRPPEPE
jgi:hypothetical protein